MLIINDELTCSVCGAYAQGNGYCANGHEFGPNLFQEWEDRCITDDELANMEEDLICNPNGCGSCTDYDTCEFYDGEEDLPLPFDAESERQYILARKRNYQSE